MTKAKKGQIPKLSLAIVDPFLEPKHHLLTWLSRRPEIQISGMFHSPREMLTQLQGTFPDILLVGLDNPNALKFCHLVKRKSPQTAMIGLLGDNFPSQKSLKRNSGVMEIASREVAIEEFTKVFQRAMEYIFEKSFCVILGVSGVKEGLGASFIASILALLLGRKYPGQVVLADLHPSRGDLGFLWNLGTNKNLSYLLQEEHFLLPNVFLNYLQPTNFGFSLLSSNQEIFAHPPDQTALSALMAGFGGFFKFIVLDLPPYPFAGQHRIIEICDDLFILCGGTLTSFKKTFHMLEDFKKLPKSFCDRITLLPQREGVAGREGIFSECKKVFFLPKASKPCIENWTEAPFETKELAPFFRLCSGLLEPFGIVSETIPPPSIIRYLTSFLFGPDREEEQ